jgi:hypothetical protein
MAWTDRLIESAQQTAPDFVIGGSDRPYLLRWWLIPRNPFLNVYLHCFLRSDDDRALHDHPWLFNASRYLKGVCTEHTIRAGGILVRSPRREGQWKFRWGASPHRIELAPAVGEACWPCWTLFITGPRVRQWGFYCMERGWIHWKRFTADDDKGAVGKGCNA